MHMVLNFPTGYLRPSVGILVPAHACKQCFLLTSMYLPLQQHQTQVLLLCLDSLPSQMMDSQASSAVKAATELKTSLC